MAVKVKDLMITNVRTCSVTDDLAVAAGQMWDYDCGCVPVLNEQGHVTGVITDRDICMAAFFQKVPISDVKVSAVMSRQLFCCSSEDDLAEAEKNMCEKKVRRLPVLDELGRLVGLLSMSDIARHADEEYLQGEKTRAVSEGQIARLAAALSKPRKMDTRDLFQNARKNH
jgi:CBS domain-containing protein